MMPRWLDSYLNIGLPALTESTVAQLRDLARRLSEDALRFTASLRTRGIQQGNAELRFWADDLDKLVRSSIRGIRSILGEEAARPATEEEISDCFSSLAQLEAELKDFQLSAVKDPAMLEQVRLAGAAVSITLKQVLDAVVLGTETISSARSSETASLAAFGSQMFSHEPFGRTGIGIVQTFGGPFAPLAEMAYAATRGIVSHVKSARATAKAAQWRETFTPASEYSYESVNPPASGSDSSTRTSSEPSVSASPSGSRSSHGAAASMPAPVSGTPFPRSAASASAESLGAAMGAAIFDFFDKGAFSAKWTQEVLRRLRGGSGSSGDGKGGATEPDSAVETLIKYEAAKKLLPKVVPFLASIVPYVSSVLGIGEAAENLSEGIKGTDPTYGRSGITAGTIAFNAGLAYAGLSIAAATGTAIGLGTLLAGIAVTAGSAVAVGRAGVLFGQALYAKGQASSNEAAMAEKLKPFGFSSYDDFIKADPSVQRYVTHQLNVERGAATPGPVPQNFTFGPTSQFAATSTTFQSDPLVIAAPVPPPTPQDLQEISAEERGVLAESSASSAVVAAVTSLEERLSEKDKSPAPVATPSIDTAPFRDMVSDPYNMRDPLLDALNAGMLTSD